MTFLVLLSPQPYLLGLKQGPGKLFQGLSLPESLGVWKRQREVVAGSPMD